MVVFTYTGDYSEADVVKHLEGLEALLREGRRCGVIFQLTGARVFSAKERGLFATFLKSHNRALAHTCVVASLVTTNPLHNGVLTAVTWVAPMPCPVKVFSKLDDARTWVNAALTQLSPATTS